MSTSIVNFIARNCKASNAQIHIHPSTHYIRLPNAYFPAASGLAKFHRKENCNDSTNMSQETAAVLNWLSL